MSSSWTKVGSNRYERTTDTIETMVMAVCRSAISFEREHWAMSMIAKFQIPNVTEDEVFKMIRNAWLHLRYSHPAIAVTANNNVLSYETPDQQDLQEWLSSTTFLENRWSLKEYLQVVRPAKYDSIHYFPRSSHVLIRMHHWLLDGTGGVALLDKLFRFLAQDGSTEPRFGDEWKHLPPSFTEVAPFARKPTPAMKAIGDKMFASYISQLPSIGLSYKDQPIGGTKVARISKANGFSDKLRFTSKAQGVSVASSVHAALAVAISEACVPELAQQNYTSVALFNYRNFIQVPYTDIKSWPTGCYLAVLPFSLPQADFATQCQAFYKIYRQPIRNEESSTRNGWSTFLQHLTDLVAQPLPEGIRLPSQPQLSSLGILDQYVNARYDGEAISCTVEDIEVVTDQMTPTIVLTSWSFNGVWHLSAVYNENFYDEGFVDGFLGRIFEILVEGLRIET